MARANNTNVNRATRGRPRRAESTSSSHKSAYRYWLNNESLTSSMPEPFHRLSQYNNDMAAKQNMWQNPAHQQPNHPQMMINHSNTSMMQQQHEYPGYQQSLPNNWGNQQQHNEFPSDIPTMQIDKNSETHNEQHHQEQHQPHQPPPPPPQQQQQHHHHHQQQQQQQQQHYNQNHNQQHQQYCDNTSKNNGVAWKYSENTTDCRPPNMPVPPQQPQMMGYYPGAHPMVGYPQPYGYGHPVFAPHFMPPPEMFMMNPHHMQPMMPPQMIPNPHNLQSTLNSPVMNSPHMGSPWMNSPNINVNSVNSSISSNSSIIESPFQNPAMYHEVPEIVPQPYVYSSQDDTTIPNYQMMNNVVPSNDQTDKSFEVYDIFQSFKPEQLREIYQQYLRCNDDNVEPILNDLCKTFNKPYAMIRLAFEHMSKNPRSFSYLG